VEGTEGSVTSGRFFSSGTGPAVASSACVCELLYQVTEAMHFHTHRSAEGPNRRVGLARPAVYRSGLDEHSFCRAVTERAGPACVNWTRHPHTKRSPRSARTVWLTIALPARRRASNLFNLPAFRCNPMVALVLPSRRSAAQKLCSLRWVRGPHRAG
jgi:hypothetical protein